MLEPAEAMAAALDPLDAKVQPFGGTVAGAGAMVLEDLAPPSGQGSTKRADLFDVVRGAASDGLVHQQRRLVDVVGEVEIAYRLLSVNRPSSTLTEGIHQ